MTFFTDVRNFLVRERIWTLLFLLLLGFYALNSLLMRKASEQAPEAPSQAMEQLRQAEEELKQEIQAAGGMQEFLSRNPKLLLIFNAFSTFLITVFVLGIFLDLAWWMRPGWRQGLAITERAPEARHWGIGTVFKVSILFILLALGLGFLLSILKSKFFPWLSPNLLALAHTTISDFLCIGLAAFFVVRLGGHWTELGFKGVKFWQDLKVGLIGYVAILPVFLLALSIVVVVAYLFSYEPPPHPLVEIFLEEEKRSPAIVAYSIFLGTVAGPFFEEIFFRGFCYPAFKKRWGVFWGMVLSATLFALIHQNTFAFWPIFVLGVGLAYLYEKRGTLVPSIALHIVHNSIFIAYFFLAKEVLVRS